MMKTTLITCLAALFVTVVTADEPVAPASPIVNTPEGVGFVIDTNKFVGGRVDVSSDIGAASRDAKEERNKNRKKFKREDICLDFEGEKLTWGEIEDYVELQLLEAPLNIPPQATLEEINKIISSSKLRLEEIAINSYLKEALLAHEAKKAGLSVSDEELKAVLQKATAKSLKKKHGKEIVPKLLELDGYFAKNQRNYLLTKKYRESVIAPSIVVSTNELAACMEARKAANADAMATNILKKAQIEDFLVKIKSGELDFGETAYEFSDCGSCMDNGDWGEFESDCTLLQPLKDFIFAPSKAEMSEIIETPYSYHIIKIIKRYYDKDEDSDSVSAAEVPVKKESKGIPVCVIPLLAAGISIIFVLILRKKPVIVRVAAHTVIWGGAAAAVAVLVFSRETVEEVAAPTRVHVAHIMLEKEEVKPELDEETALKEVQTKKLGVMTFKAQQKALETAQANKTLKCAVNITLLKKAKLLEKKMKEANK